MMKLWDEYVDIYHVRPPRSCGEHPSTYIFPEDAPPALEYTKKLKDAEHYSRCGLQHADSRTRMSLRRQLRMGNVTWCLWPGRLTVIRTT